MSRPDNTEEAVVWFLNRTYADLSRVFGLLRKAEKINPDLGVVFIDELVRLRGEIRDVRKRIEREAGIK